MKTINTVLPIYDKVEKQCFERGKKGGVDKPIPIVCPRHRLPSFQWMDDADGCDHVDRIELIPVNESAATTLDVSNWTYHDYNTFTHTGLEVAAIVAGGGSKTAYTDTFTVTSFERGREIQISFTLTLNSGVAPTVFLIEPTNSQIPINGSNVLIFPYIKKLYNSIYQDSIYLNNNATVTNCSITNFSATVLDRYDITDWFVTLPSSHSITGDKYFVYEGDTLNFFLPEGIFYLKITMDNDEIYYSDYFQTECIYENLLTSISQGTVPYDFFDTEGVELQDAENSGGDANTTSNDIDVGLNEQVRIIFYLYLQSGEMPYLHLTDETWTVDDNIECVSGLNDITFTSSWSGISKLRFDNDAASIFQTSEILVFKEYCDKYLIINFSNTCDLGDILYHDGFAQTAWIESEPMEMTFPQEDKGIENGEGRFIRTFARQVKKYLVRTKELPAYMAEVFYRMKLHDTVEIIDLVGDTNDVYNLEVEHEWLWDDRYYVKCELTFDYNEVFVITGCCNNLT